MSKKLKQAIQKEIEHRLKVPVGEKSYTESGRFEGIHVGGGWLTGSWQCTSGHIVPGDHSCCPECVRKR